MDVKDGLVAITGEVLDDVQKDAEAMILSAEQEAKKALQSAKAQADQEYLHVLGQAKVKAETEKRRLASLTEFEIRNRLLQKKEEIVDAAFECALSQLKDFVATDKYQTYLLKTISNVSKRIGSKKLVIQVNAKDKVWLTPEILKDLSRKLKINLELSNQNANFLGGCKIQTEDARVTYDSTFENRLQELKPILRAEVAEMLFAETT